MKINSSEIYLIGDNQILELIWENQFKCCTLYDWGQSDVGIDLGKSILINHYLIGDNQILELIGKINSGRVIYLIGDNQIWELIWENQFKCCTLSD